MKKLLAENMLRFGVKNLTESNIKKLQEQNDLDIAQPGEEANPLPDTPKSPEKLVTISGPDQIRQQLQGTHKDAILKIEDDGFTNLKSIPFSFLTNKCRGWN